MSPESVDPRSPAAAVFDRIASVYDGARPGYPPQVFDELTRRCGLGPEARVLEVGCGTGQATRDLAATGAEIRCLEPGAALAELARGNLAGQSRVTVLTTTFEAAVEPAGAYDVVLSATAFHWIDPAVAYAKAARLLRPGGWLALLTNIHGAGGTHTDPSVAEPIGELHRRHAPGLGGWQFRSVDEIGRDARAGRDIADAWTRVDRKLGEPEAVGDRFEPPQITLIPWLADYDRDGFVRMLASQSGYALLDAADREPLLHGVGQLIDERLGGRMSIEYVTVLAIARRRPPGRLPSAT